MQEAITLVENTSNQLNP